MFTPPLSVPSCWVRTQESVWCSKLSAWCILKKCTEVYKGVCACMCVSPAGPDRRCSQRDAMNPDWERTWGCPEGMCAYVCIKPWWTGKRQGAMPQQVKLWAAQRGPDAGVCYGNIELCLSMASIILCLSRAESVCKLMYFRSPYISSLQTALQFIHFTS